MEITTFQVERKLRNLDTSKAAGSDRVPVQIYKAAASVLSGPLTHIYNMSIQSRIFPDAWKLSNVVPLPKSSKPSIDKLRPISLLPVPSKVFEQLILHSDLYSLFLQSFGDTQFGSMPDSSTTCALIKLIDFVTNTLDKPEVAGVQLLAYDYSKAFDVLGHSTIINRLRKLSFPEGFISWIANYLTGRRQAVQLGSTLSSTLPITSGVPQGSVLGPALYCLVAGGLQKVHDSTFIMKYIDDVNFAIPVMKTGESHVSSEHNNICVWSENNGLRLNTSKSIMLLISKSKGAVVTSLPTMEVVSELRILGVVINYCLKWDSHLDRVVRSCSRKMYALRVLRPLLSNEKLAAIYFGLIRSILEYASPVFVNLPKHLEEKTNRIQKRAHWLVCRTHPESCTCDMFESLRDRRIKAAIRLFTNASLNPGHILHNILPSCSKRTGRFIQPSSITSRHFSTFVPFTTSEINYNFVR